MLLDIVPDDFIIVYIEQTVPVEDCPADNIYLYVVERPVFVTCKP